MKHEIYQGGLDYPNTLCTVNPASGGERDAQLIELNLQKMCKSDLSMSSSLHFDIFDFS